jgi:predicted metal-binding membrane protein
MISHLSKFFANARVSFVWTVTLMLALLAWIPTLSQTFTMLPVPGTMGLSLAPFLLFWTVMMVAMMFPALAPMMSYRYTLLCEQTSRSVVWRQMVFFLLGYLLLWSLFGLPVFLLAQLGEQIALRSSETGFGLGVALLVAIGLYQMTPLEKRYLAHCHPVPGCCSLEKLSANSFLAAMGEGLNHGLSCLGCCGALMLVMVVVGVMNLPWMLLITLLVFLEKVWQHGERLSFFVGFGLLIFAALALAEPALLPGFYHPF